MNPGNVGGAKGGRKVNDCELQTGKETAKVYASTKQAEKPVISKWGWVEPSVWNANMLRALEEGVKGGKWFSLIDKVYKRSNLDSAFASVKRNKGAPGIDHVSVAMYEQECEHHQETLRSELQGGQYRPKPLRRKYIEKPGSKELRPLSIPTVRDRTVQKAVVNVLEPIYEKDFAPNSYGFRPGRGCKDALREVEKQLKGGQFWVVDADLKSYFDTIPHQRLMQRVEEKVSDGRMLKLIELFLKQGVMEGMKEWTPETGTPQGGVISPLLANIYLDPLDWKMQKNGYSMIRYADDFVILCHNREKAEAALAAVREWVNENGLTLHPEKTQVVDMSQAGNSFDFLGYRFFRGGKSGRIARLCRPKSLEKFKDDIREKTKRNNGCSMDAIVNQLNPKLQGWYNYFKQIKLSQLRGLDGWIRKRLRSILRRRAKRHGISKGGENQRYQKAYFVQLGLFSLEQTKRQELSTVST
ncbi:MAG: group II intron reverse transcriptase/maturase [Victivallaceae bacterium]